MKKIAALIGLAGLVTVGACAPAANNAAATLKAPDETAILATVDGFFTAMAKKDADAMSEIVAPDATMVAIGYGGRAGPIRRSGMQGFIDDLKSEDYPDRVHEAYWDPVVLQRADLAVVWTPYRIDIGGERLHCGIDVFNLSRENGKWLVDSISFTMEPEACAELEPENVVARPQFAE